MNKNAFVQLLGAGSVAGRSDPWSSSCCRIGLRIGLIAAMVALCGSAFGDDFSASERRGWIDGGGVRAHHEMDHERARRALDRGEVLPIAEILRRVGQRAPGDLVGVEFEHADQGESGWIYELKILTPRGVLLELRVDAGSGAVLSVEDD